MIRLLGAITGSALALATLLVVVGIPQFRANPSDVERRVVTLPLPVTPVDVAPAATNSGTMAESLADAPAEESIAAVTGERADGAVPDAAVANDAVTQAPPAGDSGRFVQPGANPTGTVTPDFASDMPAEVASAPIDVIDEQWYAFWSPFRSELAANGFVEQLQRVTGLDYRVVRIKPGVYEVAFAYRDDADIQSNLSRITAATGLEMPDG